jgi:hypothetical protein
MEQQKERRRPFLNTPQKSSPLPQTGVDPETFRRVWRRVMPDESRSPLAVDPPRGKRPNPAPEGKPQHQEEKTLQELLDLSAESAAGYQALARRSGSRALGNMAEDCRRWGRKLSAQLFLLTGERAVPATPQPSAQTSVAQALRGQFLRARRWEGRCLLAAKATEDGSLRRFYETLAHEGVRHQELIRDILAGTKL